MVLRRSPVAVFLAWAGAAAVLCTGGAAFGAFGVQGDWTSSPRLGADDFMSNVITAIERDERGRIWVGTDKGLAWTSDNGRTWNFVNLAYARPRARLARRTPEGDAVLPRVGRDLIGKPLVQRNTVTSIHVGRHGLWVGTLNGLCFGNEDLRTWDLFTPETGGPGPEIWSVAEAAGQVWVSGANGLLRSTDSGTNWQKVKGPVPRRVRCIFLPDQVRGRTCWLAGFDAPARSGGGPDLMRSDDDGRTWRSIRTGTASAVATAVSARVNRMARIGKTLWACTRHGLARSADGGATWARVKLRPGHEALETFGIVAMSNRLWTATREGIFSSTDDGATWRHEKGLRGPLRCLLTANRFLWLGTSGGLLRRTRGGDTRTFSVRSNVLCLARTMEYGSETWWAGTTGGLAFSRDGGRTWRKLTVSDGLPSNLILSLAAEDDRIWVGTDGGIWAGREGGEEHRRYDRKHGLHGLRIRDIVVIGGTTWVATNRGLSVLRPRTQEWRTFLKTKEWRSLCVIGETVYGVIRDPKQPGFRTTLISGDPAKEDWRPLPLPGPRKTTIHQITTVAGDLWAATDAGLFRSADGGLSWARFGIESLWSSRVTRMTSGAGNVLAVQSASHDPPSLVGYLNVTRDRGRSWQVLPKAVPGHARAVMITGKKLVVGTRDGVSSYDAFDIDLRPGRSGWFTWRRIAALAGSTTRPDRFGRVSAVDDYAFHGPTLWVGSSGAGVAERGVPALDELTPAWRIPRQRSVAPTLAELMRLSNVPEREALQVAGFSMIRGEDVYAMAASPEGMWFGTAKGLFFYDRHDSWTFWEPNPEGLCGRPVRAIAIRGREVWVGTDLGLSVFDRSAKTWRSFTTPTRIPDFDDAWHETPLLPSNKVTALACDGENVWGGTEEGGFVVDAPGRWKRLLFKERIHAIALGSVRQYFATDRGVFALDRKGSTRRHLRKVNTPLRDNKVYEVFVDGPDVWTFTQRGVRKIHYDQAESPAPLGAVASLRGPEGVLIVANGGLGASKEMAESYRKLRGIPAQNVCLINCRASETVTRKEFERDIRDAVWRHLNKNGLSRKISFIVTIYGVPLRVLSQSDRTGLRPALRDDASVDSELALLARRHPLAGSLRNPYLNREEPFDSTRFGMYLVTRLDGPTPEAALAMAKRAVAVGSTLSYTSRGFAFFDQCPKEGEEARRVNVAIRNNYEVLRRQERMMGRVRLPERTQLPFYRPGACDNTFFYIGWGERKYRPEVFSWIQGAVGVSLDPITAPSVRDAESSWAAAAIQDGVTATLGTVADPGRIEYLSTGNLYRYLHAGYTWAEVAYMTIPDLSWQMVVFGDPLYRPVR